MNLYTALNQRRIPDTKRKKGIRLPKYYNHVLKKIGEVKVSPSSFPQKYFRWFPYFVGDRVSFDLYVENPPEGDYIRWNIIEEIGGKSSIKNEVKKGTISFIGDIISKEGDVTYSIGSMYHGENRQVIFTASVINTDRWFVGCVGLAGTIIGAIISGIILALLIVEPAWRIWIPDWIMDFIREIAK